MNNAEANQAGTISGQSGGIRKKVTRLVGGLIVGFAVAYTIAAGYMYLNQRSFIFVPSGELATPLEKGLENVSVENVQMADGTSVVVWSAEAVGTWSADGPLFPRKLRQSLNALEAVQADTGQRLRPLCAGLQGLRGK